MGTRTELLDGASLVLTDETMTRRVVVIDDRQERRALMRTVIDLAIGERAVVAQASSSTEALAAVDRHHADSVVIEIQPLSDGLPLITALRAAHPALLIVVCSFLRTAASQEAASEAGADVYLVKPTSTRELREVLAPRPDQPAAPVPAP